MPIRQAQDLHGTYYRTVQNPGKMSKVQAYQCDFKNHLVIEKYIMGIDPVEDLFDRQASFPTVFHPERTNVHYCLDCYREHVLIPASNMVDRKKDERGYELKVKELGYGLRAQTVANWQTVQRNLSQKLRKTK